MKSAIPFSRAVPFYTPTTSVCMNPFSRNLAGFCWLSVLASFSEYDDIVV